MSMSTSGMLNAILVLLEYFRLTTTDGLGGGFRYFFFAISVYAGL